MPNFAEEPLTRITINLFAKDVKMLQERYQDGYQIRVRKIIRQWLKENMEMEND